MLDLPAKHTVSLYAPHSRTYVNIEVENNTASEIKDCSPKLVSKRDVVGWTLLSVLPPVPLTWAPDWFVPAKALAIGARERFGVLALFEDPDRLRAATEFQDGYSNEMQHAGEYRFEIRLEAEGHLPQSFELFVRWDGSRLLQANNISLETL